jgi:FO synthase
MGIMLESTSTRLLAEGQAHFNSPDKDPAVRLRTLEDAGRLSIPFTSGLLIGIGETLSSGRTRCSPAGLHRRYGHLQEVIVQNFRAKPDTAMRDHPEPTFEDLLATGRRRRGSCSARPCTCRRRRTCRPTQYGDILDAGIDDWGGVSPVTPDHVNPERRGRSSTSWPPGPPSTGSC